MKQKGFAHIGLLGVLAIVVLAAVIFSWWSNSQNLISQMVEFTQEDTRKQLVQDKRLKEQQAEQVSKNPTVISRDNLVGIWHECNAMPSVWCDHYHFYSSGKYKLFKGLSDCSTTKIDESGLWSLNENTLSLTPKLETQLKNGKQVEPGNYCGAESTIMKLTGATKEKVFLTNKETQKVVLRAIDKPVKIDDRIVEPEEMTYAGLFFNNSTFWKYGSNPTSYGIAEEFPEPADF